MGKMNRKRQSATSKRRKGSDSSSRRVQKALTRAPKLQSAPSNRKDNMSTGAITPSGKHAMQVHLPTFLLSLVVMGAVLAALAAGCACMEKLRKWYMANDYEETRDMTAMEHGTTDYFQAKTNRYDQTTQHNEINEAKTKTKQTTTRSTSTKTRKCHKTTNTNDGVSALIAAGNKWTEDNKIEG